MTAANANRGGNNPKHEQDEKDAQEARGHSERVERDETIHRKTVDVKEAGAFKRAVKRAGGMWVQAVCVAAGAAVGVGGTILVQKRMNRSAANNMPDVHVTTE